MQEYIQKALTEVFNPTHLEVINESSGHNVAPGSETHFKVIVVSEDFKGMAVVKRHQAIYLALKKALEQGVHALSMHIYTNEEWTTSKEAPKSPNCMGGGGNP